LQKKLGYGWDVQAGIRHSEYSTLNTNTGIFTAERYWENFRGAYSLYHGRPEGGSSASSHVIALDYFYGERNLIGISVADGREIAGLGPFGVITTAVRAYVLRGRHWLSPDWALSYEAGYQEQGSLYTRQGIRLGLRRAF
jgi:YaiO family outer membrane protein